MLSVDEDQRLRTVLGEVYGLDVCSVMPFPLGMMNRGYRVKCGGLAYFLKDYNTQIYQVEQIALAYEVQLKVGRAGVPVPELVPNRDGKTISRTPQGFCVLSRYILGVSYSRPNIPPGAAREMGRMLGLIHFTLQKTEPLRTYDVPDPATARRLLEQTLAIAEASRGRGLTDEMSCQVLQHKLTALERLAHLVPSFGTLRTQLTHGDYQETNVLFSLAEKRSAEGGSENIVAVLDFDTCRHQPRIVELSRALSLCFLDHNGLLPEA